MTAWLGHLALLATEAASNIGPQALLALLVVALLTEVGIPFPGIIDGVVFLIGYHLFRPVTQTIMVPVVLLAGRQFGSALVFWTARTVSRPVRSRPSAQYSLEFVGQSLATNGGAKGILPAFMARLVSQFPRASRLNLANSPPVAVTLGRLTPGLLTVCSVACGILDVQYPYFVAGIAISSLLADCSLLALGVSAATISNVFGIDVPLIWLVLTAIVVNIAFILVLGRWLIKQSQPNSRL